MCFVPFEYFWVLVRLSTSTSVRMFTEYIVDTLVTKSYKYGLEDSIARFMIRAFVYLTWFCFCLVMRTLYNTLRDIAWADRRHVMDRKDDWIILNVLRLTLSIKRRYELILVFRVILHKYIIVFRIGVVYTPRLTCNLYHIDLLISLFILNFQCIFCRLNNIFYSFYSIYEFICDCKKRWSCNLRHRWIVIYSIVCLFVLLILVINSIISTSIGLLFSVLDNSFTCIKFLQGILFWLCISLGCHRSS